jgi:ribosomal-protein-alanine N-acetyltransferase
VTAFRFRELLPCHLAAVAALEAEVNPEPWSLELFAGELDVDAAERHWLVVLEPDSHLVAFGGVMYVAEDAHLMNVAVDPCWHRQGIARRLLARLFLEAVDRGAENLTLEVRTTNESAKALYRAFGFAPVGVRAGYYPDGEDALVLWVHDIDRPDYRIVLETAVGPRHA